MKLRPHTPFVYYFPILLKEQYEIFSLLDFRKNVMTSATGSDMTHYLSVLCVVLCVLLVYRPRDHVNARESQHCHLNKQRGLHCIH